MVGGFLLRCVTFLSSAQNSDKNEAALVHHGKKQVNWGTMQVYTLYLAHHEVKSRGKNGKK